MTWTTARLALSGALALCLSLAPAAVGQEQEDFDTPADWLKRPTQRDLLVVWPKEAFAKGAGGRAVINCTVTVQGALNRCVVVTEEPAGSRFGTAALALTPQFLMKPAQRKGVAVPSSVTIPISFTTPPGARPGPTPWQQSVASPAMVWARAPSWTDVTAAYPKKAAAARLGGRATLHCKLSREGRLRDCTTVTVDPKGQGFGAAAHVLAKQFQAFSMTVEGESVSGVGVQLPVTFDPAMLDGQPVVGRPSWAGVPPAKAFSEVFEPLKLEGVARAVLKCTVDPNGHLSGCLVASETPAGKGFGAAALTLARRFQMTTWTNEGLPTIGGVLEVPIRYEP